MIDIDEYIEMWNDNLLSTEGVCLLINRLIQHNVGLRHDVISILQAVDLPDYDEYPNTREQLKNMMLKYEQEHLIHEVNE